MGLGLWSGLVSSDEEGAALESDDVEEPAGVALSDDASVEVDVSEGVLVSVGESVGELSSGDGESPGDESSLGNATASALRVVASPPVTVLPLPAEVRTVDVDGGDPQIELESAMDACAARALTNSTATPKNASPIAAPSATGLRSSALTVHPRLMSLCAQTERVTLVRHTTGGLPGFLIRRVFAIKGS